ncbi:MAG: ATP-binding protein [Oceanospirillaceae bacterium]|nr:ATP-binding protein [Oceanospirillaceae bacterium]
MFKSTDEIIPDPESLLESIRSVGYSLKEAISDLIDNSISANATSIRVIINLEGDGEFHLIDNGDGMDHQKLVSSFRLGSTNPKTTRDENDLGRFGMGMKTASLSQCRSVTVTSKQNNFVVSRTLDLDEVSKQKKWVIGEKEVHSGIVKQLDDLEHGTIISWEKIDHTYVSKEENDNLLLDVRNYISLCFHRFMEKTNNKISFYLNDVLIKPISPVVEGSQIFSEIALDDIDSKMRAFTIPIRKDNNSFSIFNSFELFNGLENQQGIYIYRSDRLLCFGGWLGIVKPNNSYKLCRVIIDFKNDYSSDSKWSIDIKKTKAEIPYEYRQEIKRFVQKAQKDSSIKIGKYNRVEMGSSIRNLYENAELWIIKKNTKYGYWEYSLNMENPIFKGLLEKVKKKELKVLLDIISRNIPIADIIDNNDEEPANHDTLYAEIDLQDILVNEKKQSQQLLQIFLQSGETKSEAIEKILSVEPFVRHKQELSDFLKK